MNIAVIGIGGVGGYFGGKLTGMLDLDDTVNIYFIARSEHLREIQNYGLLLDTEQGQIICRPTLATDDFNELPTLDFCMLCVKSYDLENALTRLRPKISDATRILPLLNGVDVYERVKTIIPTAVVFPSCVYVGTHIERPGKVKQRGGTCSIHFGPDPSNKQVDPRLFEIFNQSSIKYHWSENPYTEIWSKFIFIAAFALVTASQDKTIGEVMASERLGRQVRSIMEEITAIARIREIDLPRTIVEDSFNKGKNFPFKTKTSLQRDYETKGKQDERDLFGGTVIRMGIQFGIPTDTTRKVYELL